MRSPSTPSRTTRPSSRSAPRPSTQKPRSNQKLRTRTALVSAAIELLRAGHSPTVSEVAHAALVSPATAYRYFPNAATLWEAVLIATDEPDPKRVFAGLSRASAAERVDAMVLATTQRMLDDEALWRTVYRTLRDGRAESGVSVPSIRGKRAEWIREALEPFEKTLGQKLHRRLSAALALTVGSDAVLTLRDLCGLDRNATLEVTRFSARALVHAAFAPHGGVPAKRTPGRRSRR